MRNEAIREQKTGPVEVAVADVAVVLDPSGVAFLPDSRVLVVSDLHLEKGAAFARKRQFLPPYDTRETLARLAVSIASYDPELVISLGDSFHRDDSAAGLDAGDRQALESLIHGRDWIWIAGNHDPSLPAQLPGHAAFELACGGLVFRHEPSAGRNAGEVAGHLHPGARIVMRGRSVRRPCFAADGTRLIMPSFGSYTGSLNVLDPAFRGLFDPSRLSACMLGSGRIYPVPSRRLRPD
ncbi:MAG: ligase-associated DNA damage response endonuclease PdeM [Notoacmeibacter sp.]|nr:ligase-associated DNA damage response endonuclease PdeM [Notoacmeibacter sp.]MCC0033362.1 ligase-associated DNA damage response endonuclease PdeM [Brucellaceae bacterium]